MREVMAGAGEHEGHMGHIWDGGSMLRRGWACLRAKAEGGIDEKGVKGCGDGERGTARQRWAGVAVFLAWCCPHVPPPGHILHPYTCGPHGPSLCASHVQTAHSPPLCIPRASHIQTHGPPLQIHSPPLCTHGPSLHVHGPPLHIPTHANAPYSPPLASPMPHTAHTLQHAPAVPVPPRHAVLHGNCPGRYIWHLHIWMGRSGLDQCGG